MSGLEIIGFAVVLVLMLVGAVGTLLPLIPGTPVILLAAVIHKLVFGVTSASWWVILVLAALTALSYVLDHAGQALGAKRLGATWKGIVGAILGGLIGLFFNIPGIILGPFIGAMLFELVGGQQMKPAARAGVGAVLGILIGAAGKVAVCVAMMGLFALSVVWNAA